MSIIKKAKSDSSAFLHLYDLYVERIYNYIWRRIQNRNDAEDLTSMVWEKALKNIKNLKSDEEHGFIAWLFAIARNELNQYFKDSQKYKHLELLENHEDVCHGPAELANESFTENLIQTSLNSLPPKQKEAVELKYFADLRNQEIAKILEISEKTVASNLVRALNTLKLSLQKLQ